MSWSVYCLRHPSEIQIEENRLKASFDCLKICFDIIWTAFPAHQMTHLPFSISQTLWFYLKRRPPINYPMNLVQIIGFWSDFKQAKTNASIFKQTAGKLPIWQTQRLAQPSLWKIIWATSINNAGSDCKFIEAKIGISTKWTEVARKICFSIPNYLLQMQKITLCFAKKKKKNNRLSTL